MIIIFINCALNVVISSTCFIEGLLMEAFCERTKLWASR